MASKTAVYVLFAVALGYLLISAVPNRLVDLGGGMPPIRAPTGEIQGFGDEEMQAAEGAEPRLSTVSLWEGASALGVWMVDLVIALGVYFAVRRRLY